MRHEPVNRCIYCDATDNLSDEHIVALGLGGNDVLPKASCPKCAEVTSKIELHVLRGLWWLARAVLGFPTRNPKDMPKTIQLKVETKSGENKEITLDESEKFAIAGFPEYAAPAFLSQQNYTHGISMTGHRMIGFGNSVEELAKKYNLRSISGSMTYKGTTFARMLAKIGLGLAVARFGLEAFKKIYVRDCILDKKDDVGMWVGGDYWEVSSDHFSHESKARNALSIATDPDMNVLVRIRLFSFSPLTPAYIVVVGQLHVGTSMKLEGVKGKVFDRTFVLPKKTSVPNSTNPL